MTLLSIVGALLVLTVLVFVHELGHFYAGKKLGYLNLLYCVQLASRHLFAIAKGGVENKKSVAHNLLFYFVWVLYCVCVRLCLRSYSSELVFVFV